MACLRQSDLAAQGIVMAPGIHVTDMCGVTMATYTGLHTVIATSEHVF